MFALSVVFDQGSLCSPHSAAVQHATSSMPIAGVASATSIDSALGTATDTAGMAESAGISLPPGVSIPEVSGAGHGNGLDRGCCYIIVPSRSYIRPRSKDCSNKMPVMIWRGGQV